MDELFASIVAEASASKENQICEACHSAREILCDKSSLLKSPASEVREKCLLVIRYSLESKNAKLKSLGVNGLQQLLRDDIYWISDVLDEQHSLPFQTCSTIENTMDSQPENVKIDLLKILLEMACVGNSLLTSNSIISILNICLSVASSSQSFSLSIATQATASQIVQCYVKSLISYESKLEDKESFFDDHLLPLLSFLCQKISEKMKSKVASTSDNLNVVVVSLLLKCIHSIFLPLQSSSSIVNEDFVSFVWKIWCPLQIKLMSSGITKIKSGRNRDVISETSQNQNYGRGSESFKVPKTDKICALKELFSISQELIRLFGARKSMRPVLEALFHRMLLYRPINCRFETLKAVKEIYSNPQLLVKLCFSCDGKDGIPAFNLLKMQFLVSLTIFNEVLLNDRFMDSVKECSYSDDQQIVNQSVICVVALLRTLDSVLNGNGLDDEAIAKALINWSSNCSDNYEPIDHIEESCSFKNSIRKDQHHASFKTDSLMRKDFKDFELSSYKTQLGKILESSSSLSSSSSSISSMSEDHNEIESSEKQSKNSSETESPEVNHDTMNDAIVDGKQLDTIGKLRSVDALNVSFDTHVTLDGNCDNQDVVARVERENARDFFQYLKSEIPKLFTLRSIIEIDNAFQALSSAFCKDIFERRSISAENGSESEEHFIILNSDGLYIATFSGLVLTLKLMSIGYYNANDNVDVPVDEQTFVDNIQKSGILIYLSATWLREFYQMILSENILSDLSDENSHLINLIADIGGQCGANKNSHELSHFKKMTHSTSHLSITDSAKIQACKHLVREIICRFWNSVSTILSSLFMNETGANTTYSLLTILKPELKKENIEKREALIQCLEALQITSRICILLGLQSKCNGIFDMLTKSITNPFLDENDEKKDEVNNARLHASQVLSLQAVLSTALEVSSHCVPCWDFVFICCNYVFNLEYSFFSQRNTVKQSKKGFSSVLKLKKEKHNDSDLNLTFTPLCDIQPVATLLGPHSDTKIYECLNDCIENNVKNNASSDNILQGKSFERAVECLAYLAEKVFTDSASRLNLESLTGFLQSLINNSRRELNSKAKNICVGKAPSLLHRFCEVVLKIMKSGRPLIHVMTCWSIAYPHFVETSCYKHDNSVCKASVSTINDVITTVLSTYTELPFFHFNEALFKPYESLLLLELCETDIQEMIISSICGFVEGFGGELRSGWRSLFGALRGIRLPNLPFGNHAADAYEWEMERVRQLRVILDIFEAFLDKNHLDIFANAAVDCLLCLLQLLKDPNSDEQSPIRQQVNNGDSNATSSVDLCLLALKYLHQFESMLRSMYRMPSCPMFSCNRSITTCSEAKSIEIPPVCEGELNFKVPLILSDIDRTVKILHVWYLLLDGLMNSVMYCPIQHQMKTVEMSLSMLGTLRQSPGQEFAVYCINHIALPLLQRWSRSLISNREMQSTICINNFKHFCGLLSHLVIEHLKFTSDTNIGLDLMLTQSFAVFIEVSDGGKPWPLSNLSLACFRHITLESYKFWSNSMWKTLCSAFRICTKSFLQSLSSIIDAFPNKTIKFYEDLSRVRVITKRQSVGESEEPEYIIRGCVKHIFLLDSQRSFNTLKREENDERCFLLQIVKEGTEQYSDISFRKLVRELLAHQSLLTTVAEILIKDLPHTLPNVSNFKSQSSSDSNFVSKLDEQILTQILQIFAESGQVYQNFDSRPGLKFLIQKISDLEVPPNLYQQSALCFSVQFLIYFYFCTQESTSDEYESNLKQLFEKTCEEYTDFIVQTEKSDTRLDELSQKPIFFLPQIVELNEMIADNGNDVSSNCSPKHVTTDLKIYKIVDEERIAKLTDEYKKWKCQHSPIPPSFVEKVSRKKQLPKKYHFSDYITSVEKANEICLLRDSEAYLSLWTQILQSVLELHLALPRSLFSKLIPVLEPGVETLVMYASSKDLKSVLSLWIRKVAFKE